MKKEVGNLIIESDKEESLKKATEFLEKMQFEKIFRDVVFDQIVINGELPEELNEEMINNFKKRIKEQQNIIKKEEELLK